MWCASVQQPLNRIESILNRADSLQLVDGVGQQSYEDVLRELFDNNHEELISELKQCNRRVIDFFIDQRKGILGLLVEFITVESPDPSDVKRGYRYPLIASEIFEVSSHYIATQLFAQPSEPAAATTAVVPISQWKESSYSWPLIDKLFQFILKSDNQVNEVLAGYWSKVVISLLDIRTQDMMEYILTQSDLFQCLFNHIYNQSIASMLHTLILMETSKLSVVTQESLKRFTSKKVRVVVTLIKSLDVLESDAVTSICLILSEIVQKYYMIIDGKELLESICEGTVVLPLLFSYLNCEGKYDLQNDVGLLINCLAQYYAFNANSFASGYIEGSESYVILLNQYESSPFTNQLVSNIKYIKESLRIAAKDGKILGKHRLRLVEITFQVIKIVFPCIYKEVVASCLLKSIFDVFFAFEWHNILHSQVLEIVQFLCQNAQTTKQFGQYIEHLLKEVRLTELLVSQVGDSLYYFDRVGNPNKNTTKGFLGYAIKIADTLERFFKTQQGKFLSEEFRTEIWVDFIEKTLDTHKEKGCRDLGGFDNFINGVVQAETTPNGECDMAIYKEYERQQAAEKMKSRRDYVEQVNLAKYYKQMREPRDLLPTERQREGQLYDEIPLRKKNSSLRNSFYGDHFIKVENEKEEKVSTAVHCPTKSPISDYYSDNPLINDIMSKYSGRLSAESSQGQSRETKIINSDLLEDDIGCHSKGEIFCVDHSAQRKQTNDEELLTVVTAMARPIIEAVVEVGGSQSDVYNKKIEDNQAVQQILPNKEGQEIQNVRAIAIVHHPLSQLQLAGGKECSPIEEKSEEVSSSSGNNSAFASPLQKLSQSKLTIHGFALRDFEEAIMIKKKDLFDGDWICQPQEMEEQRQQQSDVNTHQNKFVEDKIWSNAQRQEKKQAEDSNKDTHSDINQDYLTTINTSEKHQSQKVNVQFDLKTKQSIDQNIIRVEQEGFQTIQLSDESIDINPITIETQSFNLDDNQHEEQLGLRTSDIIAANKTSPVQTDSQIEQIEKQEYSRRTQQETQARIQTEIQEHQQTLNQKKKCIETFEEVLTKQPKENQNNQEESQNSLKLDAVTDELASPAEDLNLDSEKANQVRHFAAKSREQTSDEPHQQISLSACIAMLFDSEQIKLNARLLQDKEYSELQARISEFSKVFSILNENNMELIYERVAINSEIRQSFLDITSNSQFVLESELDSIEQERQKAENEVRKQFHIECEMLARQIKGEQQTDIAQRFQEEELINTLVNNRVQELFFINFKSAAQSKNSIEKFIIEANILNDRLIQMNSLNIQANPQQLETTSSTVDKPIRFFTSGQPKQITQETCPAAESLSSSESEDDQSNSPHFAEQNSPPFSPKKQEYPSTFSPLRKNSFKQRIVKASSSSGRKMSFIAKVDNKGKFINQSVEDPYEYKASMSARDKSPMPNQQQKYFTNQQQQQQTLLQQSPLLQKSNSNSYKIESPTIEVPVSQKQKAELQQHRHSLPLSLQQSHRKLDVSITQPSPRPLIFKPSSQDHKFSINDLNNSLSNRSTLSLNDSQSQSQTKNKRKIFSECGLPTKKKAILYPEILTKPRVSSNQVGQRLFSSQLNSSGEGRIISNQSRDSNELLQSDSNSIDNVHLSDCRNTVILQPTNLPQINVSNVSSEMMTPNQHSSISQDYQRSSYVLFPPHSSGQSQQRADSHSEQSLHSHLQQSKPAVQQQQINSESFTSLLRSTSSNTILQVPQQVRQEVPRQVNSSGFQKTRSRPLSHSDILGYSDFVGRVDEHQTNFQRLSVSPNSRGFTSNFDQQSFGCISKEVSEIVKKYTNGGGQRASCYEATDMGTQIGQQQQEQQLTFSSILVDKESVYCSSNQLLEENNLRASQEQTDSVVGSRTKEDIIHQSVHGSVVSSNELNQSISYSDSSESQQSDNCSNSLIQDAPSTGKTYRIIFKKSNIRPHREATNESQLDAIETDQQPQSSMPIKAPSFLKKSRQIDEKDKAFLGKLNMKKS